ncbi:MAG: acyltransferase [Mameliella sp.]|nr:acyltransferase [Mameliella sp.]|tara:strand:+ start:17721 stop:19760 length:2040 start_codon:yes stop_codon:yes gene_type:complete
MEGWAVSTMKYRPDIDGLRTLAVLPVILYHANVAGFTGGFIGVDIFFVISGYLITTIIHREMGEGRFSILRFYERRARRILPALFAVMVAGLIAGWFLLAPSDYDHMGQSMLSALLFVSNVWFWRNSGGYFDGATDYLPMLHTWSLAVEEQFYIFFPLLLMLLHRFGQRALLPLIGAIVLVSLAGAIWSTPKMPSASFYLLPTRIWELGFGALLALGAVPTQLSRPLREGLAALGLLAVVLPVFLYDTNTPFPGLAALPPVAGAALLIWTGGADTTLVARLLSLRPMIFVGLISYSLYLWHWPIMAFVRNRFLEVELTLGWQAITVIASLAAAWVSWRFVERPFRISHSEGGFSRNRIFAISGAGTAFLAALAGGVLLTNGAALQRFSPDTIALLSTSLMSEAEECFGMRKVNRLCMFGAQDEADTPVWVLWGDSHAKSVLAPVRDIAEQEGSSLLFVSAPGCPPFRAGHREGAVFAKVFQDCTAFSRRVWERVAATPTLEKVILAARWPVYIEGTRPNNDNLTFLHSDGQTPPTNSAEHNPAVVRDNMERLREDVLAIDAEFIVIGTAPEFAKDVRTHLMGNILFGTSLPELTRADAENRLKSTDRLMEEIASVPGAHYIPVAQEICDPSCPTHDANTLFYRDDNHLTDPGARILLTSILQPVLGTRPETSEMRAEDR